ncbi:hypothetical protein F4819DRAFT_115817 [Hypoxylon fuscum]|nr:hypothetical protein F4819DRAFT_115817 [Hypoxylon fuscum]
MNPVTTPYSSPSPATHKDDGYEAVVDIMTDMRHQGIGIPPVVHSLVTQLYETTKVAEERSDHLASKYMQLQAEHTQLETEFNKYCNDGAEGWQEKAKKSLYEDMCKSVDSANAASQLARNAMKTMFDEYLVMNNRMAAFQSEMDLLRREKEAPKGRYPHV